ncbi:MAG: DUF6807 family protein, partial [Planctomycetota bacterium]
MEISAVESELPKSVTRARATWRQTSRPIGLLLVASAWVHSAHAQELAGDAHAAEVQTGTSESFRIWSDDGPITTLHCGPDVRVPHFWPLHGPGGVEMTRAFPMEKGRPGESSDHPHHRSLWVAHGDVNGHDFWHGAKADARYPRIDVVTRPHTLRLGSADTPSELTLWSETWSA